MSLFTVQISGEAIACCCCSEEPLLKQVHPREVLPVVLRLAGRDTDMRMSIRSSGIRRVRRMKGLRFHQGRSWLCCYGWRRTCSSMTRVLTSLSPSLSPSSCSSSTVSSSIVVMARIGSSGEPVLGVSHPAAITAHAVGRRSRRHAQ